MIYPMSLHCPRWTRYEKVHFRSSTSVIFDFQDDCVLVYKPRVSYGPQSAIAYHKHKAGVMRVWIGGFKRKLCVKVMSNADSKRQKVRKRKKIIYEERNWTRDIPATLCVPVMCPTNWGMAASYAVRETATLMFWNQYGCSEQSFHASFVLNSTDGFRIKSLQQWTHNRPFQLPWHYFGPCPNVLVSIRAK